MKYVVTGCAGFIGSHLLAELLKQGGEVIGVDNLWTGNTRNINEALKEAGSGAESRFQFFEQDIRHFSSYPAGSIVFHLAALGSVPRSIERPLQTHEVNVDGFFKVLNRSRKAKVDRFIYASSSSVYGDLESETQIEQNIGNILNPYAASKRINEVYANTFRHTYGMECIGLRFFNVYGPRQNPEGPYAAVIPKWLNLMQNNQEVQIYGDGLIKRDFTYVKDVVKALLLCRQLHPNLTKLSSVLNVGTGKATTLLQLYNTMKNLTSFQGPLSSLPPRKGDKKTSVADLTGANIILSYEPSYTLEQGLKELIEYDSSHGSA